jgi:hypothetical protein
VKTLERGFKAWAERTSLAVRRELELSADESLSPWRLADYLGVSLVTPNDIPGITQDVLEQLLQIDPWGWSGVGLQVDGQALVIYNPRKSPGRQSSDITHELSHNMLEHQPATIIYSAEMDLGMRSFNQKQEDEANCLAWSLLLPREGLVQAKRRRLTVEQIAAQFGVTTSLVTFRLNMSGVGAQFNARRQR